MKIQHFFFYLVIFLCLVNIYVPTAVSIEIINIGSFEKAYRDSIANFQRMSYELEATMELRMGGKVVITNNMEESGQLDMEQQLFYCKNIISTIEPSNPVNNVQLKKKFAEYLDKKEDISFYAETKDNQITYLSSKHDIDPNWIDRLKFQYIAFLLGYVNLSDKNVFFLDEIKKGNIVIKKPDSNENEMYELESITEDWKINLKFVTIPQFCIKELTFLRTKNIQPLDLTKISINVLKQSTDGTPSEYVLEQMFQSGTRKSIDIAAKIATTTILLHHIQPLPKLTASDFALSIPIENGTPVFIQDAPQIEHVWFDDKIEPKTNELMLRIARGGHRFIPGVWEPRFWFIVAGAVLIFLGLFFKIKMTLQDWRKK
ncbi:MAG: hypothetical protein LBE13_21945 [Bacteroidales bacterium]|jgi:hypothetical protein|nr:hypothetical protein [Bacteroidales bacterium]